MEPDETDAGVIVIGPRRFGGHRDVAVAIGLSLALVGAVALAVAIGTPGVLGACYVVCFAAVWGSDFRRSWRISADRIEERRWFRWRVVPGVEVVRVESDRDDMGPRAVVISGSSGTLEVSLDDCRMSPDLARAVAGFVRACERTGAEVDPAVHELVG